MLEILEMRRMLSAYYVSAAGNDTLNDGSQASPWASIAKINTLNLQRGDSVLFNGGDTFNGTLLLDSLDGGSAAAPVEIGSYGVGRAVLNAGNANGIVARNTGGFDISDLNVTGA